MRRFFTFGPALLVLTTACFVLFAAPQAVRSIRVAAMSAEVTLAQAALDRGTLLEQFNAEVTAVADATLPSVAHIEVVERTGRWASRFSNGAGWVFDERGHIVTNAHVVGEAETVRVELYDGRVETGRVVGTDIHTDIALVKIEPGPGVIPIRRATDQAVSIGERVFAFGSPFGIKFSMSEGVVSGLGRSEAASFMNMIQGYTNFIQTDAAINPGNSGGPLVDINGRVIGMNAAIANNAPSYDDFGDDEDGNGRARRARPLGQSAGIGFAIPLETVESVIGQLKEDPDVVLRGYLGVSLRGELQMLRRLDPGEVQDPELRQALRAADLRSGFSGNGVLVVNAPEEHPAFAAGMRAGDVVVAIDGEPTPTTDVLRSMVSAKTPGETAQVRVWRQDDYVEIGVRLGAAFIPSDESAQFPRYIEGSENLPLEEIRRRAKQ